MRFSLKHKIQEDVKMETYAPIFSGFYETEFSFEPDYEVREIFEENGLPVSLMKRFYFSNPEMIIKENYSQYELDVAKSVCAFLEDKISDMMEMEVKIKFERIVSPQYYNFKNDSIDIEIETDEKKFLKKIHEMLNLHKTAFAEYIKENYTSRDGFISYYDNDSESWLKQEEYSAHEIGSILEFLLKVFNNDIYVEMVTYVTENVYVGSYVEMANDFQLIMNEIKFKNIISEYEKITEQMKSYISLMKPSNKKITMFEENLRNIEDQMVNEIKTVIEEF